MNQFIENKTKQKNISETIFFLALMYKSAAAAPLCYIGY